jgi:hypothetical protein
MITIPKLNIRDVIIISLVKGNKKVDTKKIMVIKEMLCLIGEVECLFLVLWYVITVPVINNKGAVRKIS